MSLGSLISEARTNAGMTIDDLAKRTNIRATMLREFEADNFYTAGGETYAKGHLRQIASILKIDSDVLIHAYENEQAADKRPIYDQLVEYNAAEPRPVRRNVNTKQLMIISVLSILVIIGGSVVYTNLHSSTPKVESTPSEKPSPTPTAKATDVPTSSAKPTPFATVSSGNGVKVVLKEVTGVSWINVTDATGTTLFSGRMNVGDERTFTSDKEINARLGNAGGLEVTVNGKKQPSLGAAGEVVTVSYGVNS
jgi:cytoskeletal protein RodZ